MKHCIVYVIFFFLAQSCLLVQQTCTAPDPNCNPFLLRLLYARPDTPYRALILSEPALIGYWPLDETNASLAARDLSSTGNSGAYSGSATPGQPGAFDEASTSASFDGVVVNDGRVSIPQNSLYDFQSADPWTLEVWARASAVQPDTGNPENDLVSKWTTGGANPYPFVMRFINTGSVQHGQFYCAIWDGGTASSVFSITVFLDEAFHHIVCTKNNTELAIYIDGWLANTAPNNTAGNTASTGEMRLGSTPYGTQYFKGTLDEVALYREVLSPASIRMHYDYARR